MSPELLEKAEKALPKLPPAAQQKVDETTRQMLSINGKRTVDDIHRELGHVVWDNCGMARSEQSLAKALSESLDAGRIAVIDSEKGSAQKYAYEARSNPNGFDFDVTMLRIAAMNLMLHGVESPDRRGHEPRELHRRRRDRVRAAGHLPREREQSLALR